MKIGFMSDSHDALDKIEDAIKIFKKYDCKVLFHGGDFVSPFAFKLLKDFGGPVRAVFGNNEGEKVFIRKIAESFDDLILEDEILITEIEGKRIIMKHRDVGVNDFAKSQNYDFVFYGHTHKLEIREIYGSIIVNPGECCGYLTGKPTVSIIDLATKEVKIIDINEEKYGKK